MSQYRVVSVTSNLRDVVLETESALQATEKCNAESLKNNVDFALIESLNFGVWSTRREYRKGNAGNVLHLGEMLDKKISGNMPVPQTTNFKEGDLVIHFQIKTGEVYQNVLMITEIVRHDSGHISVYTNDDNLFNAKGLNARTSCNKCNESESFIVKIKDIVKNEIF